jgi:hypothetical protein
MAMTIEEAYVEYRKIYDFAVPELPFEELVNVDNFLKCPAAPSLDSGVAYDGALIYHTILVYHFARKVQAMFGSVTKVDDKSLAKIVVLHQLGKVGMFIPNEDEWQKKKLGKVYTFVENGVCLKTGERSRLLCSNAGIKFTSEEYEAMCVMDKTAEEYENMNKYRTMLSTILRTANDLAYTLERERTKLTTANE